MRKLFIILVVLIVAGCGDKKQIDFGNQLIESISKYQKTNNILPETGDWNQLKKLGFEMHDVGTNPTYKKISDSEYELIYLEGFDGPYLMYNSESKKWSNGFSTSSDEEFIADLITNYPNISDTNELIKRLVSVYDLMIDSTTLMKQDISRFEKVNLYGSDEEFILIEYDYHAGAMACFPYKYQLLFTEQGELLSMLTEFRIEFVELFDGEYPLLLTVGVTAKGNGWHSIYKFAGDTIEDIFDRENSFPRTYDKHEDTNVNDPNELVLELNDVNDDGFKDLVFTGNVKLLGGLTPEGMYFDALIEGKDTTTYNPEKPFKTVPVEYVFIYNKTTQKFVVKEDYFEKYKLY